MTEREIYEKFGNLSEDELNTKSNKNIYVKNDVMTTITKCCRDEKKKRHKSNRWIQKKKLIIPDLEIPKCPEFEV